jgi:hypothetical protein
VNRLKTVVVGVEYASPFCVFGGVVGKKVVASRPLGVAVSQASIEQRAGPVGCCREPGTDSRIPATYDMRGILRTVYLTGQRVCIPHERMRSARDPPLLLPSHQNALCHL